MAQCRLGRLGRLGRPRWIHLDQLVALSSPIAQHAEPASIYPSKESLWEAACMLHNWFIEPEQTCATKRDAADDMI
jgi:hypothetical protein